MHIYSKSVHTNACNKQSDVCYLSYFHVHTAINILRFFGYSREQNFGLVLILSEPNRLYRRLRLFPSKLQEYTPPPFSRLSSQYHIDPLLVFFLSILHERVCDYSRVQSPVTGILRMGDMNIYITWLTHVRTGAQKKKIVSGEAAGARLCVNFTLKLLLSRNFCNQPLMRFISFVSCDIWSPEIFCPPGPNISGKLKYLVWGD